MKNFKHRKKLNKENVWLCIFAICTFLCVALIVFEAKLEDDKIDYYLCTDTFGNSFKAVTVWRPGGIIGSSDHYMAIKEDGTRLYISSYKTIYKENK